MVYLSNRRSGMTPIMSEGEHAGGAARGSACPARTYPIGGARQVVRSVSLLLHELDVDFDRDDVT